MRAAMPQTASNPIWRTRLSANGKSFSHCMPNPTLPPPSAEQTALQFASRTMVWPALEKQDRARPSNRSGAPPARTESDRRAPLSHFITKCDPVENCGAHRTFAQVERPPSRQGPRPMVAHAQPRLSALALVHVDGNVLGGLILK